MSDLKSLVASAADAWTNGDLEAYLRLYDPSITLHGYGPQPMNLASARDFYRTIFESLAAKGRPSPTLRLIDPITEDRWYACHFEMSGEHTGPFLRFPATGRPYRVTGVTMIRFNHADRAVERHSSFDALGLMIQIGAIAAPG